MKKVVVFMKNLFDVVRGMWYSSQPAPQAPQAPQPPKGGAKVQTLSLAPPSGGWGAGRPVSGLLDVMEEHLGRCYEFRFNMLTEGTEFRRKDGLDAPFRFVGQRELNGICLDLRRQGIECWDRDVARYVNSTDIGVYHPMREYMESLPEWDGADRLEALARRVSGKKVWVSGFRRWMLGVAAQWMGVDSMHGNSVAPVLISPRQGMHKSTFCKMLVPDALQAYYTDSYDLASVSGSEQKLALFGLVNLDELDKLSDKKMALLKNLMQMAGLNIRKAYRKTFSLLPRMASFIATSNRRDLLSDPTGSRRFLCVEVEEKIDCSPIDHLQLYAQLKAELAAGERYWFTTEEETEIMLSNAPYHKRGMEEDIFYQCYRQPEKGETADMVSAAQIFSTMKKKYPAAMREVNTIALGRLLTATGLKRTRTKMGNMYHVVSVAS